MKTIQPPDGLESAGIEVWRTVVRHWNLDPDDRIRLANVCAAADDVAKLEAILAAEGFTVKGSKGQTRMHPAVSELRVARANFDRLFRALRLPPLTTDDETEAEELSAQSRRSKQASYASRKRWQKA